MPVVSRIIKWIKVWLQEISSDITHDAVHLVKVFIDGLVQKIGVFLL